MHLSPGGVFTLQGLLGDAQCRSRVTPLFKGRKPQIMLPLRSINGQTARALGSRGHLGGVPNQRAFTGSAWTVTRDLPCREPNPEEAAHSTHLKAPREPRQRPVL